MKKPHDICQDRLPTMYLFPLSQWTNTGDVFVNLSAAYDTESHRGMLNYLCKNDKEPSSVKVHPDYAWE